MTNTQVIRETTRRRKERLTTESKAKGGKRTGEVSCDPYTIEAYVDNYQHYSLGSLMIMILLYGAWKHQTGTRAQDEFIKTKKDCRNL